MLDLLALMSGERLNALQLRTNFGVITRSVGAITRAEHVKDHTTFALPNRAAAEERPRFEGHGTAMVVRPRS